VEQWLPLRLHYLCNRQFDCLPLEPQAEGRSGSASRFVVGLEVGTVVGEEVGDFVGQRWLGCVGLGLVGDVLAQLRGEAQQTCHLRQTQCEE
jgi:hypothetical protein